MECLQALRKAFMEGKIPQISQHDTSVVLDDRGTRWPLETKTAWMNKSKEFYTLHELILFLIFHEKPIKDYIKETMSWKVKFVSNVDRKELLAYLKGEIETSDSVKTDQRSIASSQPESSAKVRMESHRPVGDAQGSRLSSEELRSTKHRHAEREDNPAHFGADQTSSNTADQPALLDGLSHGRLLELRAKRQAKRRAEEPEAFEPPYLSADREAVTAIRANEKFPLDRRRRLQCEHGNFRFVLDLLRDVRKEEKDSSGKATREDHRDDAMSVRSHAVGRTPAKTAVQNIGQPIIIVPSLASSLITLWNAKEYFENGKFDGLDGLSKKAGSKPHEVRVDRRMPNGSTAMYRLVDNPARLKPREWDHVVCVLVQGNLWQFKKWKWEQPVQLFQHALGVHYKYDDEKLEPTVSQWNVQVIEMNKYRRHSDRASCIQFWKLVDDFMVVKKLPMYRQLTNS